MSDEPDKNNEHEVGTLFNESESARVHEFYGTSRHGANRRSEYLWLVSYSDFITIMMIFFLAMYGYSHMKNKKNEIQLDAFASMATTIKAKLADQVRIVEELDKVRVELGEGVLFRSGHSDLSQNAFSAIASIGPSIAATNGDVIVEGHTDNVPVRGGSYKSNWELSAARAFSVIQALKKSGVPGERLTAWGFGENRPILSNGSPEGRQRNRRIEIIIMKKKMDDVNQGLS